MKEKNKDLIIAGNWKMNKTPKEAGKLINKLKTEDKNSACKIVLCVPFIDIPLATDLTQNTLISIGAQNCYFEKNGAYTGEISAEMLKEIGVEYVIIGHSERRIYFNETDEQINKKINSALKSGLKVIFCIGENLQERENNITEEKLIIQIKNALYKVDKSQIENIIIAYEPVWAIGSGKTPNKDEIDHICQIIRNTVFNMGKILPEEISVLYGGSINSKNAKEILTLPNVDGGLIGGASLDIEEFLKIINCTAK